MLPLLYSFRRCPYAIRARMALKLANQSVELREVLLRDKPTEMLTASAKGTVPVMVLADGRVIDESREIMEWAFQQSDPQQYMFVDCDDLQSLVDANDLQFKPCLDRYKYADRHPEQSAEHYRGQCEPFLATLEQRLNSHSQLLSDSPSSGDLAVFPFIRQFAFVDKGWFDQTPFPGLHRWLKYWLESPWFSAVMQKHPPWKSGDQATVI